MEEVRPRMMRLPRVLNAVVFMRVLRATFLAYTEISELDPIKTRIFR